MKNKACIKRKLCLVICLCLVCVGCTSCQTSTDAQLLSEAQALCEASVAVNEICFGKGIAPLQDGYQSGGYTEADAASLSAFGVTCVADIKAKIAAVYTAKTCEWIEQMLFSSNLSEGVLVSPSRYYDGEKPLPDGTTVSVLMVKDGYEPLTVGTACYSDYAVVENKSKKATVSVTVKVELDGAKQIEEQVPLTLRYEFDHWRLDTPTYKTFVLE